MTEQPNPSSIQVHQFAGLKPGPKLIVFGAVHGNEICGTIGIQRVIQELENGSLVLERGTVTFVPIVNPLAYRLKQRNGDRNLNRNMRISSDPQDFEDKLSNVICPLLEAHDVLLDLHSFHTPGIPFALFGPEDNDGDLQPFVQAAKEESLALQLGVNRFVEGWLETYAQGVRDRKARGAEAKIDYGVGTTETMRSYGGMAITLECGQHDDEQAPEIAYQAIRSTLSHLGLAAFDQKPLPPSDPEVICLHKVIDRLHPDDKFSREWKSFDELKQGDLIAVRQDGSEIHAEKDGWIVFPNPTAQVDQEWFYLAKKSARLRNG